MNDQFSKLLSIMDELRAKCPWDAKQTIHSLRQMTIEETYELADAITDNDWKGIKEELGDMLLHIVFYAKIANEQEKFTMDDVINGICQKLIHRHPHIYCDVKLDDADAVKKNWEQIKLKEGKTSVIGGVPRSLPSMVKAMRLQEKAKQVGFEWETTEQVWRKVEEETLELTEAVASGDMLRMEDELGDLFFSLINYARFLQIDSENALERTNKKFISRFTQMENVARHNGLQLQNMTLAEMDTLWNEAKQADKTHEA